MSRVDSPLGNCCYPLYPWFLLVAADSETHHDHLNFCTTCNKNIRYVDTVIKGRLLPARIGLTITKTGNATLATWHPHFHSVPFNLGYVLKSLENRLHVLVVDQVKYLLGPQLCSPFEKDLQSFQFKPALCLACQRCVCQSGQVKLEGGAEAEALWRSRWKNNRMCQKN